MFQYILHANASNMPSIHYKVYFLFAYGEHKFFQENTGCNTREWAFTLYPNCCTNARALEILTISYASKTGLVFHISLLTRSLLSVVLI